MLPLLLTIVGWIVVAYQTDRRERRRDIREHIGDAREHCRKIADATASYWITAEDATTKAVAAIELKAEIISLSRTLQVLAEAGLSFERWDLVSSLRQTATGSDFEVKGRRRRAADREKLPEVRSLCDDLLTELQRSFYDENPIQSPVQQFRWLLLGLIVLLVAADGRP